MHTESSKLLQTVLVVLVFFLVTGGWEFYVWATETPAFVLPAPSVVGGQLWSLLGSGIFWVNFKVTMYEVLMGYLLGIAIAVVLGVLISQVRILDLSLMPYIVAFQTIPSVALAPIFLQWFGYGLASKVIMAALIAFFPMLVNVIAGLQASGRDEIQMLKAFGANRFQILMKVRVPNSMPYVFAGLGLGVVFALVGAIVAEFVGAQQGLGKMILQFNEQFNIAGMFAVLVVLATIGMTMHSIVGIAKRRIVFWAGEH
ncbi:ABC transporter permease [Falsochrobactrum sp. TDYN1]|uniref:ABC transporter permease n=1 Tax=Falsochrobactrum tianjinense TaxID=2706015 RepID=A0A949UTI4_9HYPH|nr:ABC transporter permease [Falsochrobactrum sp. TDYN1]MBV2142396.1 ABC transporter permease [Falsochrobactrum sp. TDYN1]